MSCSRDGNPEFYTTDTAGGGAHRLTHTPNVESSPTWSPDGSELIYVSGVGRRAAALPHQRGRRQRDGTSPRATAIARSRTGRRTASAWRSTCARAAGSRWPCSTSAAARRAWLPRRRRTAGVGRGFAASALQRRRRGRDPRRAHGQENPRRQRRWAKCPNRPGAAEMLPFSPRFLFPMKSRLPASPRHVAALVHRLRAQQKRRGRRRGLHRLRQRPRQRHPAPRTSGRRFVPGSQRGEGPVRARAFRVRQLRHRRRGSRQGAGRRAVSPAAGPTA